jgi:hypothetical protein
VTAPPDGPADGGRAIALRVERTWSDADVLTVDEVARRLAGRRVEVHAWLQQLGLLARTPWGDRVVWGAVVRAMDPHQRPDVQTPGRRVVRLPPGVAPVR